jgi:hypothetical protein
LLLLPPSARWFAPVWNVYVCTAIMKVWWGCCDSQPVCLWMVWCCQMYIWPAIQIVIFFLYLVYISYHVSLLIIWGWWDRICWSELDTKFAT